MSVSKYKLAELTEGIYPKTKRLVKTETNLQRLANDVKKPRSCSTHPNEAMKIIYYLSDHKYFPPKKLRMSVQR